MQLALDASNASKAARLVSLVCGAEPSLTQATGTPPLAVVSGVTVRSLPTVLRTIVRHSNQLGLLGHSPLDAALVDEWLAVAAKCLLSGSVCNGALTALDARLATRSFVATTSLSLADYALYAAFASEGARILKDKALSNVARWFAHVQSVASACTEEPVFATHRVNLSTAIFSVDFTAPPKGQKKSKKEKKGEGGGDKGQQQGKKQDKKQDKKQEGAKGQQGKQDKAEGGKKAKPAKPSKAPAAATSAIRRLDVRVAVVVEAEVHPSHENLLVCSIDAGEEKPRPVVCGVAAICPPEEMKGKRVCLIVNLKASEVKGVHSAGRVLVATGAAGKEILSPPEAAPVGELITFGAVERAPDDPIKEKNFKKILKCLKTTADGTAVFENDVMTTSAGAVVCGVPSGTIA